MNRVILAALTAVSLAALAACSSSASAANTTASASQTTSAAASPSANPEADACKVLAAMTFDASTQDKSATTQDQLNAALNLLPQHDALGTDALAAEQDLVTLDIDLFGKQSGAADYAEKYQTDAAALQSAMETVASDCGAHGVPFTASVKTAP